jgi:S1-C subfamily serine protease/regulation of enolase protein 1 (concanavalin A-like superfamily)
MFRYCHLVAVGLLLSSPLARADDVIPEKQLDALKAATVYVKVDGKQGTASGSGFLIHVDGETGLVATNRHVIAATPGRFTPTKYSLVFSSGTKKERVLKGEVVAIDPDEDLAVLKVVAKDLPAPLTLNPAKLRETMTIYTFGFPLGEVLSADRGNPGVTIGKGTIGALPEDSNGKIKRVQLDGELNPGNSGGPIVDGEGKLVGIAVSKIVGTKISFAIPPTELATMLQGRVSGVVFKNISVDKGMAEVELEVALVDPLQKIKRLEIRHVRKDAVKQEPKTDPSGSWADLTGAEVVPVKVEKGKAIVRVTLSAAEKKPVEFYFQGAYARDDGKLVATRPVSQSVNFSVRGATKLDGLPPWKTIVSKEGGFTVDMPVEPDIKEGGKDRIGGVDTKSFLLGCETENGVYLAYRLDLPGGLRGGTEERFLDALRDFFVNQWHGKLLTEKKVRAQGNMGRDFTIRGKPDKMNFASIRVRQYLVGKSIFAVVVISMPDAELPEDSGRFLGSLALGQAQTRATGTPEPEHKGTELEGWGLAIDPDKDCKITPGEKSLTFEIPGKLHDLFFDGGPTNSPRVMREVEGDFVVKVKVSGEFKPGPRSTNPKSVPYHGAGFLLWSDSDNNIRFERFSYLRGGKYTTGAAFQEREGGYGGADHTEQFKAGDCYLRIERKGSRIVGAISNDGSQWKELKPIDTVWPAKLKIGLAAITTSSEPFNVKFEQFELKQSP